MYQKPTLERFGSLRDLTQFGSSSGFDGLGIFLNIVTGGAAGGDADGCNPNGGALDGCIGGSHS